MMFRTKNKALLLGLALVLTLNTFWLAKIQAVSESEKSSNFEEGQLLKAKGVKGGAVYQIGADGKKYIFPDQKTFKTWFEDFNQVKEVSVSELDKVSDGGAVTFQPGSRLITHQNTKKVFIVSNQGQLYHVPNETVAKELFGSDWSKQVDDIDPGIFASTYKDSGQEISSEKLPDGVLVQEQASGDLFLIDNQQKRKVEVGAYGVNGLQKRSVVSVPKLPKIYQSGDDLQIEEKHISQYNPGDDSKQVMVCHFDNADKKIGNSIKISEKALSAHLAHGDKSGECAPIRPIGPPERIPSSCEATVEITRGPFRTTHWTDIGLDTSAHADIVKYQIKWFSGYWSPWYTVGVDDVDWNNPNRRVWSLFDDHTHRIISCNTNQVGPAKPDLAFGDVYIYPPQTVHVGDVIQISARVKNLGATLTSPVGINTWSKSLEGFEWQTDFVPVRTISTAYPLYQNETIQYVAKGKFVGSGGQKTLNIKVDSNNQLAELDENNNTASLEILVLGPVASIVDIKAVSLNVAPENPQPFATSSVRFEGKNNGDTPLTDGRGLTNFFRVFGDFVQTSLSVPNFSTSTPLLPGQSYYIYIFGYWETAGSKALSFKIDNSNQLVESNEDNNWAYLNLNVGSNTTTPSSTQP